MPFLPEYDPRTGKTVLVPGLKIGDYPGRLLPEDLLPGDVLVWFALDNGSKDDKKHAIIREATEGAYSHVGIYLGAGISIDAGPDGVSKTQLESLMAGFESGDVLRYRGLDKRIESVLAKARSFEGYDYAKSDANRMPFRRAAYRAKQYQRTPSRIKELIGGYFLKARLKSGPPKNQVYCSQMVIEAYGAAGIYPDEMVRSAAISPNDLIENGEFEYMGFISNKPTPQRHLLDINADVARNTLGTWKFDWRRLLGL